MSTPDTTSLPIAAPFTRAEWMALLLATGFTGGHAQMALSHDDDDEDARDGLTMALLASAAIRRVLGETAFSQLVAELDPEELPPDTV
jgi:hypothetical protein